MRTLPAALGSLLLLAACEPGAPPAPVAPVPPPTTASAAPPAAKKPAPIVVGLVIDQFSAWIADERIPKLPADGGFARLRKEGTWAHTLRYPYAITDTAPGHASLHSGVVPNQSGIFANEHPDEKTGYRSSVFIDPAAKLVTPHGKLEANGRSIKIMKAETTADRLRAARPDATVISISLKDRASLLPAGKKPTHAIFFDAALGSFVTTDAVESTFPSWAVSIGDAAAVKKAMSVPWEVSDRDWLVANAGKDDAPGEGSLDGMGTTFPHKIPTAATFRMSPNSDGVLVDLAIAALKAERKPDVPFLLLLSLTAHDIIGHTFGPSSWEAWDEVMKLDRQLARLFTALDAAGEWSAVLSADHGDSPMPEARLPFPASCKDNPPPDEYERPTCIKGGRLEPEKLRVELIAEVKRALGREGLVAGVSDGLVFLTKEGRSIEGAQRAKLDAAVKRVILEKHAADIVDLIDEREMKQRCPGVLASAKPAPQRALPGEDIFTLACRSWTDQEGTGDWLVVLRRGSFFDGEVVIGKGSSHGSPYLYDRTVPLFVRTATRADAGRAFTDPVDFSAYAALSASFLGLDPRAPREILDALTAH